MSTRRCDAFLTRYDRVIGDRDPYGHGRNFAKTILCPISDLDLDSVTPERRVDTGDGHHRNIDFGVEEGAHVRLAIEVDGWNKTGEVTETWTKKQFYDFFKREMQLNMLGWRVLRFTNRHARNQPLGCSATIQTVLQSLRQVNALAADELVAGKEPFGAFCALTSGRRRRKMRRVARLSKRISHERSVG